PVSAPDLDVYTGGGDSMKQALTSRFPPAQKSNGAAPPRVLGRQRTVDFIAISERHINNWSAEHLVLFPLIRLAINKRIERTHGCIHKPCAFPVEREIWVRCEVNASSIQLAQFLDRFGAEKLLL